jgi:hypothetical protein
VGAALAVKQTRLDPPPACSAQQLQLWNGDCLNERAVVGRITEAHLFEAEKTFPGIGALYRLLPVKPATFLQLLWQYETREAQPSRREPGRAAR